MEGKVFKIATAVVLLGLCCTFSVKRESYAKVVKPGFLYIALPNKIKKKMNGVSYKTNPHISYKELRYVEVKYYNFNGKIKTGQLIVNKKIAGKVSKIFYELYKIKYPIQRMKLIDEYGGDDEVSMSKNNTSAFNYRMISGSAKLSNHAYGLAIDINPRINPYIVGNKITPANGKVYANRNRKTCKGKYRNYMIKKNDAIVKIFKKYGFYWGGDWNLKKDYQHFEY